MYAVMTRSHQKGPRVKLVARTQERRLRQRRINREAGVVVEVVS
jgi:hypothetical protein